jgi:hypothetical protein
MDFECAFDEFRELKSLLARHLPAYSLRRVHNMSWPYATEGYSWITARGVEQSMHTAPVVALLHSCGRRASHRKRLDLACFTNRLPWSNCTTGSPSRCPSSKLRATLGSVAPVACALTSLVAVSK